LLVAHQAEQQALLGGTGDDRRSRLAAVQQLFARGQIEPAAFLARVVALQATGFEQFEGVAGSGEKRRRRRGAWPERRWLAWRGR